MSTIEGSVNRNGFTLLLAGGGFKPGYIHGATNDVGYKAVEGRVSTLAPTGNAVKQFHRVISGV